MRSGEMPTNLVMAKVNQQMIADQLDIDRTTVSRCFSNHPKINPDTRARVLELAAQLGYRYKGQRATKDRVKKRHSDIGVLIGVRDDMVEIPATSQYLLKGISERAAMESLSLDVRYIDPAELDAQIHENRFPKGMRSGKSRWNGAILIFPFTVDTIVSMSKKISTVSIAEDYSEGGVDCIDVDHHSGIYQMVAHLAELGHKKIGFYTWKYSVEAPWLYRRFGAFVDSLYRLGLAFEDRWALNVRKNDRIELPELENQVVEGIQNGVTAWVCAADHQAYDLMSRLEKRGISIPKDCSITGFDGIVPPASQKQLTTINVPFQEMGVSSVIRLIDRMRNPAGQRRHNLVEGIKVIGETTAPPAS